MDCVDIYNKSINEVLNSIQKNFNINDVNLKDNYTFIYKKRVTGYLLFVKEQYDNCNDNEKCNSSIISKRWKSLSKEEKQVYTQMAKKQQINKEENIIYKNIKKSSKIKQETTPKSKNKHRFLSYIAEQNINNNNLYKINLNDKEYIIDCFKNIIDIKDNIGKDIGFIDEDDNVILF